MSQLPNGADGAIAHTVPLFASNLMALYMVIRSGLAGQGRDAFPLGGANRIGATSARH